MTRELWVGGVLFPPLLLAAGLAWVAVAVLRRMLARLGLYRMVWHPALFDLALFVIVWGAIEAMLA